MAMGAAVTKHADHTPPELNPNYEAFVRLESQAEQRTEDSFATSALCCSATVLTMSSSVSRVILKMSPCSVWARKKNMDLVLCVAEQTKIIPLSGSSKSFCQESTQGSLGEDSEQAQPLPAELPPHGCPTTDHTGTGFQPQHTLPCRKYLPQVLCLSSPPLAPFALLLEGPLWCKCLK